MKTNVRFADAAAFPYGSDYLPALRGLVEAAVDLLVLDERVEELLRGRDHIQGKAEGERERLEILEGALGNVLKAYSDDESFRSAVQVAEKVRKASREIVRQSRRKVGLWEKGRCGEMEARLADMRRRTIPVAAAVLAGRGFPGTRWHLRWRAPMGQAPGDAYLHGMTPFGLEMVFHVSLTPGHVLAEPLRVGALVPGMSLDIGRTGFLGRGESQTALDAWRITDAEITSERAALVLRRNWRDGIELALSSQGSDPPGYRAAGSKDAFTPLQGKDLIALGKLLAQVEATLHDGLKDGRNPVRTLFGETPLEKLRRPGSLAEAMIAAVVPTVHRILSRSGTPRRLVLMKHEKDKEPEALVLDLDDLMALTRSLSPSRRALFVALVPGAPRLATHLKPHRLPSAISPSLDEAPTTYRPASKTRSAG